MLAGARIGSYIGIVTDIPMPGQLVELNKRAWLLLTHYNVSQLHGLRVGAMVGKSLFQLSTEFAVHLIRSIMVIAWPDPWYQCSAGSCKTCAHHGPRQCRGEGAAARCLLSVTCVCCSFLWFECYVSQHPLQQVLWGPSSWACGVFPFLVKHIEVFDGCTVLGKHLYLWSPLLKGAITQ
jgi:hypothetical protein